MLAPAVTAFVPRSSVQRAMRPHTPSASSAASFRHFKSSPRHHCNPLARKLKILVCCCALKQRCRGAPLRTASCPIATMQTRPAAAAAASLHQCRFTPPAPPAAPAAAPPPSTAARTRQHQYSTVTCRAHLPHLDEEYLQWQLHLRSSAEGTSRRRLQQQKQQLASQQAREARRRRQLQLEQWARMRGQQAHSDSQAADGSPASKAGAAAGGFHCVQLSTHAAAHDLRKQAISRMAKHIAADGGCCVAVAAQDASVLTHVLLHLQQQQNRRQLQDAGAGGLLLLQPLGCEAPSLSGAAAGAAPSSSSAAAAASSNNNGPGSSTVVQGDRGAATPACAGVELSFFASFMPPSALLGLQEAATGAAAAPAAGGEFSGSMSLESLDVSIAGSLQHRAAAKDSEAALFAAARSSSAGVAALLLAASQRSTLNVLRAGGHADAAALSARLSSAASSGQVTCLHVRDGSHAVAYAALAAVGVCGVGMLLVPGRSHEHVHATSASHQHHQHHQQQTDASMDAGSVAAAFYGLPHSVAGSVGQQQQHGDHVGLLQHRHAQEVWMCVLPLGA